LNENETKSETASDFLRQIKSVH